MGSRFGGGGVGESDGRALGLAWVRSGRGLGTENHAAPVCCVGAGLMMMSDEFDPSDPCHWM